MGDRKRALSPDPEDEDIPTRRSPPGVHFSRKELAPGQYNDVIGVIPDFTANTLQITSVDDTPELIYAAQYKELRWVHVAGVGPYVVFTANGALTVLDIQSSAEYLLGETLQIPPIHQVRAIAVQLPYVWIVQYDYILRFCVDTPLSPPHLYTSIGQPNLAVTQLDAVTATPEALICVVAATVVAIAPLYLNTVDRDPVLAARPAFVFNTDSINWFEWHCATHYTREDLLTHPRWPTLASPPFSACHHPSNVLYQTAPPLKINEADVDMNEFNKLCDRMIKLYLTGDRSLEPSPESFTLRVNAVTGYPWIVLNMADGRVLTLDDSTGLVQDMGDETTGVARSPTGQVAVVDKRGYLRATVLTGETCIWHTLPFRPAGMRWTGQQIMVWSSVGRINLISSHYSSFPKE
jgi:hypothetical protein